MSNARQNKVLELISKNEIGSQEELAFVLRANGIEVTQATVSRDVKKLGLVKILSQSGNYRYASVDGPSCDLTTNTYLTTLKSALISVKAVQNLCVLKTIKGMAGAVCSFVDKLNLEDFIGAVNGDDTVMIIFANNILAEKTAIKLQNIC